MVSKLKKVACLCLILFLLQSCSSVDINDVKVAPVPSDQLMWPKDGVYVVKWDSFHAYDEQEIPFLPLNIVVVHRDKEFAGLDVILSKLEVVTKQEVVLQATDYKMKTGYEDKNYSLITLEIQLPKLSESVYELSKLKLNDKEYNIGNWLLDIRKNVSPSSNVIFGKKSFLSAGLDFYRVEVRNISNEKVCVRGLHSPVINYYVDTITSAEKYENLDESKGQIDQNCIEANSQKAFQFNFKLKDGANINHSFFSIRPYLIIEKKGKEEYTPISTAMFVPMFQKDYELIELLKRENLNVVYDEK
ncbi:hypothetical protein [Paenibacillus sp. UNC499MF]|uniref:hypothetical protein n=1 Tax=Paenibacillus sp. UNC499MF TaxID=1502751 RepID=UPI0008A001DB|nr:hypothetical protein [Paenibacillus sp. UNC499MF]SEF84047.1 hypothetical protein SAMN02799616_01178 [Paenibacillus sp. UNC499MF]